MMQEKGVQAVADAGLGLRVVTGSPPEFRVQGAGFRVQGSGFRVQGTG